MDSVNIAGISIPLRTWSKDELKGLPVIYSFSYHFYDFSFRESQMILLESVKEPSTPTAYRKWPTALESNSEDLLCFTLTTSYITNASDW